ncbi:MAG: hypothetical protein M5U28_41430 [Sandaracinaceae bacterium]|nr:hypothetical protein [Sandaracinaceae bacterium]
MGERIAWARERAGMNKNQFARRSSARPGSTSITGSEAAPGRAWPRCAASPRCSASPSTSLLGVRTDPSLPEPSGLERFLVQLAPADLTEDEAQWLRKAPVDERAASPEDYRALLAGLRRISSRPAKSGRRRKVEPASVETAIGRRRGDA